MRRNARKIAAALLILLLFSAQSQAAFTEFYCNASTGSNVNAGSTEGASVLSLTGGDWNSATGAFTKTGAIAGVSVGDFAAVRVDAATVAARFGRVTAVDANTITISTTAGSGSLANQTATCSIEVGGAWKGPNAAEDFPLDVITNAAANSSGNWPRINLKNNATYSISASIAPNQIGPITVQGYASTVGDGGQATIDGSTNTIVLLAPGTSADGWSYWDLVFSNNGASGTNAGVSVQSGATNNNFYRCKFTTLRGSGLNQAGGTCTVSESEFTACNQSNTLTLAGIAAAGGNIEVDRCYFHDNTGNSNAGIYVTNACVVRDSIFDTNGLLGIYWRSGQQLQVFGCDFYNNGSDGIREFHDAGAAVTGFIENCNFIDNGGYGLNLATGSVLPIGTVRNCGFGAGTAANTSGQSSTTAQTNWSILDSVTYPDDVTPWSDPANGDFSITLRQAKQAGTGDFPGSTIGYPDIGAAQSDAGGGAIFGGGVVR